MAVTSFIPELWSARLLRALEKSHVYGSPLVVNRDYEGEIRQQGDTVNINTIGAVTIGNYTGADIGAPEELTTTNQQLLIDQAKFYNFAVDDVDRAQAAGQLMGPAMEEAGYGLRNVSDTFIAGLYTGIDAGNHLGTDGVPIAVTTAAAAYDQLVELSRVLDDANVPDEGRFAVIPPWYSALLAKDTRLIDNVPGLVASGLVGQVDRLRILRSNNVPATTNSKVIAGWNRAISFAEQIVSTEAYRPEAGFKDAVKGLHVYGGKIVKSTELALLHASST